MAVITQADLENAQRDAADLGKIVGGAADLGGTGVVATRLGGMVRTVLKLFADITADAVAQQAAAAAGAAAHINDLSVVDFTTVSDAQKQALATALAASPASLQIIANALVSSGKAANAGILTN